MSFDTTGFTYCHEHLHIDLSPQKGDIDCKLDQFELIKQELISLRKLGVRNIVEVTNRFMGRNPQFIEDLTKASEMNVVLSTGYYIEGFFPDFLANLSIRDIAQTMIDEIEQPLDGTSLKASVIGEIGSSENQFSPLEKNVFLAAAIAHKETGAPISTHTSFSTMAKQQIQLLGGEGIDLRKVTIGHCDLRDNLDDLLYLLDHGCYVQLDTIGKNSYYPDEKRIEVINTLIARGYVEQLMLSMDITRRSHLKANGGLGFSYLMEEFVPRLFASGVSESDVEIMLKHNPNRFFNNG
ncbi:phosphotriesterase-related protein [Vibrio sp. SCSIO 43133]|uniref:phosphotriesterase family protein n=1 Tax=Vibrio sp. SCSIO 43133 TaxID=2802577 RepID=UPI0020763D2F|nr:phosphotriesterase-related protein [Vibrio sp. SCSIO 43133]USE01642.1 phosphotriesterase-related protein [Vibrio sp. SCSIO 43133]